MWNLYLKNGMAEMEKYAVPFRETDFTNISPTYIESQEIDVLRDEAVAYGEKLKCAGVWTEIHIIQGSYHGYDNQINSPLVQKSLLHRMEVMKKFWG